MNTKKYWSFPRMAAIVAVSFLFTGYASLVAPFAEAADEFRIGYIDLATLFDNYERTKQLDSVLEQKGKQKEAELEGKVVELRKLQDGLEILSDKGREAKATEVERKAEELQLFRNRTARDLRRERDKAAGEIFAEIQTAVQEYSKQNQFALVLDERSLLYGREAFDIPQEILKLLNDRYKKAAQ